MSAKILVATAVMAMGSFMFVDTADAQRRGGAERGDNGSAAAGQRRGRGGARQARGSRNAGQARGGNRTARAERARPNRARPNRSRPNRARPDRSRPAQANRARPNRSRPARANRRPRAVAPRAVARQHRRTNRRSANRNAFSRGWRQARHWAGRTWAARPHFNDYGCTAVARRDDGYGRVIPNVYGEGYGRRACRKALNVCEDELFYRQALGQNPYAACVVASR